jgi:hypothetical protein
MDGTMSVRLIYTLLEKHKKTKIIAYSSRFASGELRLSSGQGLWGPYRHKT